MISTIFLIAALVITLIYNSGLPNIPESISATSYLPDRKPWYFSIYCLLMGTLLWYPWMNVTPDDFKFLVFFACMGIYFAGVTPFFKSDFEKPIHYTAGVLTFASWLTWIIMAGEPTHLIITASIYVLLLLTDWLRNKTIANWTYWAEMTALIYIIIYLSYATRQINICN